jgi:hypothetical protein
MDILLVYLSNVYTNVLEAPLNRHRPHVVRPSGAVATKTVMLNGNAITSYKYEVTRRMMLLG